MQALEYFSQAVEKLKKLYDSTEAEELVYWLFEDKLLIKKAHLRLFDKDLSTLEEMALDPCLNRLIQGEPIQYVLGYAYFMDLILQVNSSVLIPRPETEELVLWSIETLQTFSIKPIKVLDICCGSGCISFGIKHRFPTAELIAIDVSDEALDICNKNSKALKLSVQTERQSVLDEAGMHFILDQNALVWVCNPPYITPEEKSTMHPNVLAFEPHLALFVESDDPLLFYSRLIDMFLESNATQYLLFEISEYQQEALQTFGSNRNILMEFKTDLQGKVRMLRVSKPLVEPTP